MAQLVRVDQQAGLIKRVFAENHARMVRLVPKTAGDPNRLLSIAFSTIAYDSKLVLCTPESLFGGVLETLKLGLTIGGPAQESWLIPFRNHGRLEATLIIGYQGYRNLIDRSRAVLDLHPRAVYTCDDFDFEYGSNPRVSHRPWNHPKVDRPEPGPFWGAYSVARLRGGGLQIEVMEKAEIDAHRARSKAKDNGPWVTDYVPMALKTTIRKISKYLPKASFEMARALELDEQADMGVTQIFDVDELDFSAMKDAKALPATGGRMDALKESLGVKPADPSAPLSNEENAEIDRQLAKEEGQQ